MLIDKSNEFLQDKRKKNKYPLWLLRVIQISPTIIGKA